MVPEVFLQLLLSCLIFTVVCLMDHGENQLNAISTDARGPAADGRPISVSNVNIFAKTLNFLQTKNRRVLHQVENMLNRNLGKQTKREIVKALQQRIHEMENNFKDELEKMRGHIDNKNSVFFDRCDNCPEDCRDVQSRGANVSGMYLVKPRNASNEFWVWCDQASYGGGWTTVLKRFDGSQDFYQSWSDYEEGFGDVAKEFWLGLKYLYQLTSNNNNELLFELVDWESKMVHAIYDNFRIGGTFEEYSIKSLGKYSGTAGDAFRMHIGLKFSTFDRIHDNHTRIRCAEYFKGAWWYHSCYHCHLTGRYLDRPSTSIYLHAIHWYYFHGYRYSLKEVRMMVRPKMKK